MQFLAHRFPTANFSEHIFNFGLVVPTHAVEFFLIFEAQHFDLIVLLLLQLSHRFLFITCLLHQLRLLLSLLEPQPLDLTR